MPRDIQIDKSLDVIVVSFGGVGTTLLIDQISRYLNVNDPSNKDGIKHMPIPPLSKNRNLKAIYVFGDPIMSTVSLFRRKYHATQSYQLQKFRTKKSLIAVESTLSEYAISQHDKFYFADHWENWSSRYSLLSTLFVRYDFLYKNLEKIRAYLDLPEEFISDFPEEKKRRSELNGLPLEVFRSLNKMYGHLQTQLTGQPSVFFKEKRKLSLLELIMCSKLYRVAIFESFVYRYRFTRMIATMIRGLTHK